jgi:hypothetical protein
MRVDHDRAPLNLERALPEPFVTRLSDDRQSYQTDDKQTQ